MDKFKQFLKSISPITDQEFADSIAYFTAMNVEKNDFFVKPGKVCKHIGFIVKGTMRTYYLNDKAEETTSCFCTENSLTTAYKSFILQQPSELILQALEDTQLLVIDYDNLQKLYAKPISAQSPKQGLQVYASTNKPHSP